MKTVGLLGGMSWESTLGYYRALNEGVRDALGELHSAKIVLFSVNFNEIETLQRQGDWEAAATLLAEAARKIEKAGADFLLICTNTMHKVAPEIENAINIPVLHIADATAAVLVKDGIKKVGLIGTSFTMEQDFYKGRLEKKYGIEVIVPARAERETIHNIIFKELCRGEIRVSSQKSYIEIINELSQMGAEAVILGCTEIGLLVKQSDTAIQLYDTTQIHTEQAVKHMLNIEN